MISLLPFFVCMMVIATVALCLVTDCSSYHSVAQSKWNSFYARIENSFVWFVLNVAFNLFQSYRDGVWMWQRAQCSLLECCLTEISRPRHFDMIFHPVTLYCHWADQFYLYFLNAERQAKEQLIPFLKLWYDPTGDQTRNLLVTKRTLCHWATVPVLKNYA